MAAGLDVIVPPPVPALATSSGNTKRAPTERVVLTVTVQVRLVPLHAPDQPLKLAPVAGMAVSVTTASAW